MGRGWTATATSCRNGAVLLGPVKNKEERGCKSELGKQLSSKK